MNRLEVDEKTRVSPLAFLKSPLLRPRLASLGIATEGQQKKRHEGEMEDVKNGR